MAKGVERQRARLARHLDDTRRLKSARCVYPRFTYAFMRRGGNNCKPIPRRGEHAPIIAAVEVSNTAIPRTASMRARRLFIRRG